MRKELSEIELKVLKYHKLMGADYSKLVSHRFGLQLCEMNGIHKSLLEMGLLEKVNSRTVDYHMSAKRTKKVKSRNHTYYTLSRQGRLFLREYEQGVGDIDVDVKNLLEPSWR